MRRATLNAAVIITALLVTATPAAADTGGSANTDGGGVHSGARTGGNQPGGSSSGGRPVCTYTVLNIPDDFPVYDEDTGQRVVTDGTGQWYEKWCDGAFVGSVYISRRNPQQLLAEARRYLPLPLPVPRLNPAGDQLVNLPTWMWLDGGWTRETSSVSVPGITVTVSADPVSATWTMGDGSTVVCDGPGTPFDPSRPSATQLPSCTHTYARSSAGQTGSTFPVSVTVRWRATWDVVGFVGGGDLGTIDRTTTFTVRVGEVQAVNTRGT